MKIYGTTSSFHFKLAITVIILALQLFLKPAMAEIEVQGHRGARSALPENSLPGFNYALELGVDTLELDMGVSKDGVVVVVHDQKINPTICQYKSGEPIEGELWIHQLSLDEIKAIDCGSKVNPRFSQQTLIPGTEIPTLAEVFQLVKDSSFSKAEDVLFNIETKSNPSQPQAQPEPEVFIKAVLAVIDEFDLRDRVCIQSFDHRTLLAAHQYAPEVQRSALFERPVDNWAEAALEVKADIVSPYFKLISKDNVVSMQAAGLRVIPWTANTTEDWDTLLELGVDGIISDDPAALLQHLARR